MFVKRGALNAYRPDLSRLPKLIMPSQWEVTYTFDPPIPYKAGPLKFDDPNLRLTEASGLITTAHHYLDASADDSEEDVLRSSRELLDCFLTALRFLQLTPIHWWATAARLQPTDSGSLRLQVRASGTVGSRAIIVPSDGWLTDEAARLAVWLYFASEAQESASGGTAIRLYFLIIEELSNMGELSSDVDELIQCLKAIRDFVSHPKIEASRTQDTLRRCALTLTEGPDAFRYRPSNVIHRATLDDFRMKARALVDGHLHRQLGLHEFYWPTAR
jgi:hypothetical protein